MELLFNTGIHNKFDIIVRDSKTSKIIQEGVAHNIILNGAWSQILRDSASFMRSIAFGSGVTTPLISDTALTIPLGSKDVWTKSKDYTTFFEDGVLKLRGTVRLEASEYVGQTISEVGITTSNGLATKALLTDSNGNPISIIKTDTSIIDIFATVFFKIEDSFTRDSGDMYIADYSGLDSNYAYSITRWLFEGGSLSSKIKFYAGRSSWERTCSPNKQPGSGVFYDIGPDPIGVEVGGTKTWDVALKKVTWSYPSLSAGSGNIGGLRSVRFANGIYVNLPNESITSPLIVKEVLAIGDGSTKDFKCKFGRIIENQNLKLYVNDVEVDATFNTGVPNQSEPANEMLRYTGNKIDNIYPIWENIYNDTFGISKFTIAYNVDAYCSDNIEGPWTLFSSGMTGSANVPTINQKKRYWYFKKDSTTPGQIETVVSPDLTSNLVIHAATPPPVGSTVTLTYNTDCLPKDETSVLNNLSLSLIFNEYIPD